MKNDYRVLSYILENEYHNDKSSITLIEVNSTQTSDKYFKEIASKISQVYIKNGKIASIYNIIL